MQPQVQEFSRHLRLSFIVPVALAALLAGAFAVQTYYLRHALQELRHSYDVQLRSRSLLKLMLDMETGLRGYLLTGEERFLQPYRESLPKVEPSLQELAKLVSSDPQQRESQVAMHDQFRHWQNYAEFMIKLRDRSGSVSDPKLNLRGKTMMDDIRGARDRILNIEEQRLRSRIQSLQRTLTTIFLTGIVLSLAIGLIIATFSRRELASVAQIFNRTFVTAHARTEELQLSQSWLTGVLTSIGDGVIATDKEGRISFSNAVAQQLLNRSELDLNLASSSETIQVVDEYTRELLPEIFGNVARSGQRFASSNHSLLLRHDGSEIPITIAASPMRGDQGELTGAVIVLRDMTEQRQSERTLQSTEKLASIGRLAASVAHEIHNPLDSIGNLLYLLEHGTLDDISKTYVRLAREELERISNISEQMLTFSRESRQPVEVDISEVLENVLTLFSARMRRQGIVLVKSYETSLCIKAFPGELRQVFSNLVGNALDAMPGSGRLTIRTRAVRDWDKGREGGRILICDTGTGIPEEVRPRLMDPFVTSKGEKGTGLGLWVCRGILEKYQGTLRYRTSTEQGRSGTCFSVFLPKSDQKSPRAVGYPKAS